MLEFLILPLYTAAAMERLPTTMIKVGETIRHEAGIVVSAVKRLRRRIAPGRTAFHEAAHIEASQLDEGIDRATIVGTSEYNGATWPRRMTATSAMAAAALDMDGTGWDEFLTAHILHVNPDGAKSTVLSILAGRQDYMWAVAEILEEKKTIGQEDVNRAHEQVDNERRGVWQVDVMVKNKDGTTFIHSTESENNNVMVPGEWVVLHIPESRKEEQQLA